MGDDLDLRIDRQSDVPLGAQLAARIGAAVANGQLSAGDRLPSVRELAEAAGVNVNTVRAVYARLEADGVVRSEHGRGTFVARAPGEDSVARRKIRAQIVELEATLARLPPPPLSAADEPRATRRAGAALLSTEELLDVRDRLLHRLRKLEAERTVLLRSLEQLASEEPAYADPAPRRSSPSLAGAHIRWLGA